MWWNVEHTLIIQVYLFVRNWCCESESREVSRDVTCGSPSELGCQLAKAGQSVVWPQLVVSGARNAVKETGAAMSCDWRGGLYTRLAPYFKLCPRLYSSSSSSTSPSSSLSSSPSSALELSSCWVTAGTVAVALGAFLLRSGLTTLFR